MTTTDTTTRARELAQQLSELSEKATPGEWHMLGSDCEGYEMALLRETEPKPGESGYQRIGVECVGPQGSANQDFIVFTRNNAAAIADTLTALSDENAKLREALCSMVAEHCAWDEGGLVDDLGRDANMEALTLLEQLGELTRSERHPHYEWADHTTPQEPAS